jgi:ribosome biogenesis protein MAK21
MVDEQSDRKQNKVPRRRGRKGKVGSQDEDEFKKQVSSSSHEEPISRDISYKPHKTLLIHLTDSTPTWYECGRGTVCRDDTIFSVRNSKDGTSSSKIQTNSPSLVAKYRKLGESIYQHEVNLHKNNTSSNKDEQWVENTMRKGTLKDRIAAMSVVVSSSPVHKLYALDMLLNLAGVSTVDGGHGSQTNERVASMAAEALTDLFVNTLLPKHRKLVGLESRPFFQYEGIHGSKETKRTLSPRILLLWYYEEIIKSKYAAFISQYLGRTLSQTSTSQESMTKVNALRTTCQLLKEIPEGEQTLLGLIVNKIGDPTKKIASAAAHELRNILDTHPNMTKIIAREVRGLLIFQTC